MGLFDFKLGNTNIDESKTIRENVNNTILNTITNSTFTTKVQATSNQKIIVDCSGIALALLKSYENNPSWGPPPAPGDLSKLCTLENIKQISEISLNVTAENKQDFATEVENDIKRDFQQMDDITKDKDWVSVGGLNKNINKAQSIRRIVDNVTKSNIKNIVMESITAADVNQDLVVSGPGNLNNVQQLSKISIIVTALTDSFFKEIDKTFLDTKVSQLKKETETDAVTRTFGDVAKTYIKTVGDVLSQAVSTAGDVAQSFISTFGMIWIVIIGGIIALLVMSPKLLCIPPASFVLPFCSASTEEKSELPQGPPNQYFEQQGPSNQNYQQQQPQQQPQNYQQQQPQQQPQQQNYQQQPQNYQQQPQQLPYMPLNPMLGNVR